MIPLPSNRRLLHPGSAANQGLVHGKFFDKWPDPKDPDPKDKGSKDKDFKLEAKAKADWVAAFAKNGTRKDRKTRKPTPAARLAKLVDALGGKTDVFTSTAPFVTGVGLSHPIENGFTWHHTEGCPVLPGSSVKGMVRAWARDWLDWAEEDQDRVFGPKTESAAGPSAGSILFFDALPVDPVTLTPEVLTPHIGPWRLTPDPAAHPPGDWINPVPIPYLAVAPGARFQFALASRAGAAEGDLEETWDALVQALEWVGAGAKTAVGFGRFLSGQGLERRAQEEKERRAEAKRLEDKRMTEAKRLEDERVTEAKRRAAERKAQWVPKVGDRVFYTYGEDDRKRDYEIVEIVNEDDFVVALPDGSGQMASDRDECHPLDEV